MKLYMVPLAPNPTKVMLYIAERGELGVDMGIEQIVVNTLKRRNREPEHLARNPFGTLPVLELDDGTCLVESLAIIEYLEDRFTAGALLAENPDARGRARDVERIIDLRMAGPMAAYVHAKNSPLGLPPDPGWRPTCRSLSTTSRGSWATAGPSCSARRYRSPIERCRHRCSSCAI